MIGAEAFPAIGAFDPTPDAAAALTLIEDYAGRVLLQLRDDTPKVYWPGKWGLIGGGIEPGEDIVTAAIREVAEETGLSVTLADLTPFAKLNGSNDRRSRLFVFRTRLDISPADIRLGEGAGFAFWTRTQLPTVDILDSLAPLIGVYLEQSF